MGQNAKNAPTFQDLILRLQFFWAERGCVLQLITIDGHGWGRAAASTNQVSSPTGRTRAAGSD